MTRYVMRWVHHLYYLIIDLFNRAPTPPPPRLGDTWYSPNECWGVTWDYESEDGRVRSGRVFNQETGMEQGWVSVPTGCHFERFGGVVDYGEYWHIPDYVLDVVYYFWREK